VPVGAPDSLEKVEPLADEVVCLYAPANFAAVGQFYRNFDPVTDDEVTAILSASGGSAQPGISPAPTR
jgi:predicted phosphoribosyltransferase